MQWPDGDPWTEAYDYGWWLCRHGLSPQQVDEMPAWLEARLTGFTQVWDDVASRR